MRCSTWIPLLLVAIICLPGCKPKTESAQPNQPDSQSRETDRKTLPSPLSIEELHRILKEGVLLEIPTQDKDQHGNPVITRNGAKRDSKTGLPFEIWMKSPQLEFVLIPAGTFRMGNPNPETCIYKQELPAHPVRITRPFYLAKYEVTQKQWMDFTPKDATPTGENPSGFKNAGPNAPVERVSWDECVSFCMRSSLSLPTEAQWEAACRAGTTTEIYTGPLTLEGPNGASELEAIAWFRGNAKVEYKGGHDLSSRFGKPNGSWHLGTHPVGKKKSNAFGLYDMLGNVGEWCLDSWDPEFYAKPGASGDDPVCRQDSDLRVRRGGGWYNGPTFCRCAFRSSFSRTAHYDCLGFRPTLLLK